MSRHAAIDQPWADGTYTFRLGLDEIEELERKRDLSIFEIVERLRVRRCRLPDISEVLRIGLIGGGTAPLNAMALVKRYVDERPIDESRDIAYAIGLAALMRLHTNDVETLPGEAEAADSSVSTSPPSTETPS